MNRSAAAIVTLVVGVLMTVVPATSAAAHSRAHCGATWGSQPRSAAPAYGAVLTDVRAGRHACFDRLVIDGGAAYSHVGYVDEVGTVAGDLVPVRGGASLLIVTGGAPDLPPGAGGSGYDLNADELVDVRGFRTFRHVAGAGSFEGHGYVGLGVRARLPFRVFSLAGPGDGNRLVIDVAHHW